jgi:hypothetical protein
MAAVRALETRDGPAILVLDDLEAVLSPMGRMQEELERELAAHLLLLLDRASQGLTARPLFVLGMDGRCMLQLMPGRYVRGSWCA